MKSRPARSASVSVNASLVSLMLAASVPVSAAETAGSTPCDKPATGKAANPCAPAKSANPCAPVKPDCKHQTAPPANPCAPTKPKKPANPCAPAGKA